MQTFEVDADPNGPECLDRAYRAFSPSVTELSATSLCPELLGRA